jgi:hypothetical protein
MRFQVPQFIDVEDKIFGPLSLRQFLYLTGGGAAIFLLYISLPFFLFVIMAAPIGALAAALAFYKVNGKPFIKVVENALRYSTRNKIYTWKKRERPIQQVKGALKKSDIAGQIQPATPLPALTKSKLKDLAWSLDIKENLSPPEENNK